MRYLLTALLLPALVSAQELHTFKNGEVADAEKLNESLQYILNNASGGCSVEQVDNTAEITCADGTTAVVPGYGTVVVYPEGVEGELPSIDYNTGPVVLLDNNNVVLGASQTIFGQPGVYWLELDIGKSLYVFNDDQSSAVIVAASSATSGIPYAFYLDADCSGAVFLSANRYLVEIDGDIYTSPAELGPQNILTKAKRSSNAYDYRTKEFLGTGDCEPETNNINGFPGVKYTPAPEILNAAYPVRLEQLP
jgi:hypothetical protein